MVNGLIHTLSGACLSLGRLWTFVYYYIPLNWHLWGPNKLPIEWVELYCFPSIVLSLTQPNQHIYHCKHNNTSLHDYINLLVKKIWRKTKGIVIYVCSLWATANPIFQDSDGNNPFNSYHDVDGAIGTALTMWQLLKATCTWPHHLSIPWSSALSALSQNIKNVIYWSVYLWIGISAGKGKWKKPYQYVGRMWSHHVNILGPGGGNLRWLFTLGLLKKCLYRYCSLGIAHSQANMTKIK